MPTSSRARARERKLGDLPAGARERPDTHNEKRSGHPPVFCWRAAAAGAAPSYGAVAAGTPTNHRSELMGSRTSARSGFRAGRVMALSVGACGVWAPRAALDYFA